MSTDTLDEDGFPLTAMQQLRRAQGYLPGDGENPTVNGDDGKWATPPAEGPLTLPKRGYRAPAPSLPTWRDVLRRLALGMRRDAHGLRREAKCAWADGRHADYIRLMSEAQWCWDYAKRMIADARKHGDKAG